MLKQLSVMVENKPGSALSVMKMLSEANVNARSITISESQESGIIRLIVDNVDKAERVLSGNFEAVKVTDVIGFSIPDEPGGLCRVMQILEDNGINIRYSYSLMVNREGKADIVIRVKKSAIEKTMAVLSQAGIKLLTLDDIS